MKTSVNMLRKMGGFKVTQRTKDSMFNATDLLKQWNAKSGMRKEVSKFFELSQTKIFIDTLITKELQNTQEVAYLKTRGKNGGTWMHPFLYIKFCMWINPEFELDVIKFVYDQLIEYRHSAGDMYRGLTNAMSIFPNVNYVQVAKALNWIVFNKHEPKIRNSATQKELNELVDIQKKLAFAVDMNYIKTYEGLVIEMRRIYHIKHNTWIN